MKADTSSDDPEDTKSLDVEPAQEANFAMLEQAVQGRLGKNDINGELGR